MSPAVRRAAGVLVALGVTGALVVLSRAPAPLRSEENEALLRVSWSGRPERIERCRERSDSELARVPAHMRQRVECEGRSARYAVRVADGARILSLDTVTGGGLRGDRPIHMLREYRLAPGPHAIAVEVARTDSAAGEIEEERDHEDREEESRRRARAERVPARLAWDSTVQLAPAAVLLVTYDQVKRRLVSLTSPAPPPTSSSPLRTSPNPDPAAPATPPRTGAGPRPPAP
jgi:hypothetical protein